MHPIPNLGANCGTTPPANDAPAAPAAQAICGDAPLGLDAAHALAARLQDTLDVALYYALSDGIDMHVCDLRQLANWGVPISAQERELYFYPWTIDASDPVFPVTLNRLRQFIAAVDDLVATLRRPTAAPLPGKPALSSCRIFG